ncbi:hypothetical protein [uncultured Mailhella sp.]|uniref:hypothetical protein n=1 Tax=uncultured Mailhella sp. TaxID=1981031 RepID=UPI0025DCFFE9|nr:hypothetical protein [uncultured Mailhella sp.]
MTDKSFRKAHRFTSRWETGSGGGPGFAGKGRSFLLLGERGVGVSGHEGRFGVRIDPRSASRSAGEVRRAFGNLLRLDDVPPRCAMVLYDTAVGMGPEYAAAAARQALGFPPRFAWNERLRSAFRHCNDAHTAAAICHLRRGRYCELVRRNPDLGGQLRGWLGRVDALECAVTDPPS